MTTKLWTSVKQPHSSMEFLHHDFEIGGKKFTANIDHNPTRGFSSMLFSRSSGPGNAYSLKGDMGVADARSVMLKMLPLVHEHLHGHKPNILKFSADGAEPSRVKMYDWLAKRVHRIHPDYVALHNDDMEDGDTHVQRDYYLVHKDHVGRFKSDMVQRGWPEPEQLARQHRPELWTPEQLTHLKGALDSNDAAGWSSFADRLQEDGHPMATVFNRIAIGLPLVSQGISAHQEVDHTPNQPLHIAIGSGMTANGKMKFPAVRIADRRGKAYHIAPLRKSEYGDIHKLLVGHHAEYEKMAGLYEGRVPAKTVEPEQLSKTEPRFSKMTGRPGEGRTASFTTTGGHKYTVAFHPTGGNEWGLQFSNDSVKDNPHGITGTGHAKEVITNVIKALHGHVKDAMPTRIHFQADPSETSRVKLYDFLVAKANKIHPEYHGTKTGNTYSIIHESKMPKPKPEQLAATKRNFLHDLAESYHEKHKERFGLDIHPTDGKFVFDPELGKRTAAVFDKMKHQPDHPFVKKAYGQMKAELLAQYHHLTKAGIKFEPWDQAGQPYKDSKDMQADVLANKRVKYFKTAEGFGSDARFNDHPLMEEVPHMPGVKYNDLLRGVHDVLAHAKDGHQFGPKGEFQAWGEHARLFSPLARAALTTETHGQNSWVNFGPHGHKPVTERPFADQKAAVLPKSVTPKLQLSRPVESDLSQQGQARKKLLLKLLLEAKLKPVAFGGSYSLHASGMDAGSYAEVVHNNEPDAVSYVGHYYGLLNGQGSPDLHVFHQNDTGNHSLTVFDSPLPTDKLYEALAPALQSPMVRVIPKEGFNRVAVVNLQDSGILKASNAANTQQFRGDFSTLRGRGSEGASAREGHRNAIQAYERQYAGSGT